MKTALHDNHIELGAKMVDFAGWMMPIQYKNLKQEVLSVRENVGVFDVSHMGEFFITGPEAINFVDFLVTNDIKNSPMSKAIYSPLCREDGTIIDDLIVYKLEEEKILICVNAANIEKDYTWIKSKIDKFDCVLEDQSKDFSLLAVQGPKTVETLRKVFENTSFDELEYYSIAKSSDNYNALLARTGYTGEDGFEIFADHKSIAQIWSKLMELGVEPCGLGARDVLRLEVCYPLYGHELNDHVTPLDSGLKWTVKFAKNDFIGKQALESYQAKYRLIRLTLDKGIPREGYLVENNSGEKIGEVTSGTMSVVLSRGIAIARIEKNLYSDDDEIFINIRNKKYNAHINKKPFVAGGHK
jgi:aminomethyltransferase